ncbi:MAG: cytidine deaminase, partial [Ktedonobacterales bacterium]
MTDMTEPTGTMIDHAALLARAREAAQRAYAPYSRFRVGAAVIVETADGPQVVTGANVENASYGLSFCAERAALAAACQIASHDLTTPPTITHIAIACRVEAPDAPLNERMPCGACRQWIAELAPNAVILVDGAEHPFTVADLLPTPFRL